VGPGGQTRIDHVFAFDGIGGDVCNLGETTVDRHVESTNKAATSQGESDTRAPPPSGAMTAVAAAETSTAAVRHGALLKALYAT